MEEMLHPSGSKWAPVLKLNSCASHVVFSGHHKHFWQLWQFPHHMYFSYTCKYTQITAACNLSHLLFLSLMTRKSGSMLLPVQYLSSHNPHRQWSATWPWLLESFLRFANWHGCSSGLLLAERWHSPPFCSSAIRAHRLEQDMRINMQQGDFQEVGGERRAAEPMGVQYAKQAL